MADLDTADLDTADLEMADLDRWNDNVGCRNVSFIRKGGCESLA